MPSKSTKKVRRPTGKKKGHELPVEKDDGTRWEVVDKDFKPVYLSGSALTKSEAERLAKSLLMKAHIRQVK